MDRLKPPHDRPSFGSHGEESCTMNISVFAQSGRCATIAHPLSVSVTSNNPTLSRLCLSLLMRYQRRRAQAANADPTCERQSVCYPRRHICNPEVGPQSISDLSGVWHLRPVPRRPPCNSPVAQSGHSMSNQMDNVVSRARPSSLPAPTAARRLVSASLARPGTAGAAALLKTPTIQFAPQL